MPSKKIAIGIVAGGMFLGTTAGVASAQLPEGYLQDDSTTTTAAGGTTTTTTAPGGDVDGGGASQNPGGGTGGSGTGRSGGALSRTGSDVLPLVGIASAAVLLGGAFIYGARRPSEA